MWDLPRPGIEPMILALAGGFLTIGPPGPFFCCFHYGLMIIFSVVFGLLFHFYVFTYCSVLVCIFHEVLKKQDCSSCFWCLPFGEWGWSRGLCHYPLDGGFAWWCGDQSLSWILNGASSLLCGCDCSARGSVCSMDVGTEAPIPVLSCVSDLQCEIGRIGALPLGEKPLNIPSLELFTCDCALLCPLSPLVWANKIHCC